MLRVRAALPGLTVAAVLVTGCTASTGPRPTGARSSSPTTTVAAGSSSQRVVRGDPGVLATSTLTCHDQIDGSQPPRGFTVVLGAVALPAAPGYAALQASADGPDPASGLFAKTGLWLRAGTAAEIDVPASVDGTAGIGWSGAPSVPSRTFVVPACPDLAGTGWLSYPGGYWAGAPLCLPLDVRAGGRQQRVQVGIGTACPGQSPPPR